MSNFELMTTAEDPFIISTKTESQRELLKEVQESIENGKELEVTAFRLFQMTSDAGKTGKITKRGNIDNIGGPSGPRGLAKAWINYLVKAIGGGLCFIVPMLIMVLKPSLINSLVTTSVCISIFAL
ncbi:hypothetical protein CPLU01_15823 [Colletotrichum plurivorum]|uniref:Uncharacterized protein n=1 Tax=Colletotrichum plurivorum TaxID=2175906 RepID=A0A8H6J617_9PEZI|nr:hypothetical protein CPLU01_15823 [Colletotrichum plurivorum]